ncbi:Metallo-dependent phosphatase-like protein [Crucibulum laeve]|uniref:Metallo-dependent phosphatase-like protein n=1 Tax=Crucibulum laeve TaxID=68775 RepID=A0A5C3LKW3_9AGAR|nr:Metallo-dependent phosphatase-like protein [Crucibulum laeve]
MSESHRRSMVPSANLSTSSSQVYVQYDSTNLPPHPGKSSTRFVCISDTHSRTSYFVPPGDILLHAGDLSSWGYPDQMEKTLSWLASLPHSVKIIVAGNHNLCLDSTIGEDTMEEDISILEATRTRMRSQSIQDTGIYYLEHESMVVTTTSDRSWKVYGSPAAPQYARGAFQYSTPEEAKEIYRRIPNDTEILLTHTPPYRILDKTRKGVHAGCRSLAEQLQMLESCKLNVFGQVHYCHPINF